MTGTGAAAGQAFDVWAHQERVTRQLATWAVGSIVAGGALAATGHATGSRAVRAFGAQTAAWGAVDLGIAVFGELRRRGRLATVDDPYGAETLEAERRQSLQDPLLRHAEVEQRAEEHVARRAREGVEVQDACARCSRLATAGQGRA